MKILLVDNYDSFVYNVVGLLEQCRATTPLLRWDVVRNDEVTPEMTAYYDAVILSPGPGIPTEAGRLAAVVAACIGSRPLLGICLGCQAIAEAFGLRLRQLEAPRHGHASNLRDVDAVDPVVGFLAGEESTVGRYHSWVIDDASFTPDTPLKVGARDEEGNVMSVYHPLLPVFGLQFHPESIITGQGLQMLRNFLAAAEN